MPAPSPQSDIVVIGAGPVGLFAVFQAGMLGLNCTVIDALDQTGGQCTALYPEKPIYDIPGFPRIEARELVERLAAQAAPFAPTYLLGQRAATLDDSADGGFVVGTSAGAAVRGRTVLVAAGAGAFGPNRPPLPGIEAFEGKSVFYMVHRRADLAGKRVVIAGGGDSAVDWALALADTARRVTIVHRRDRFRAAPESERRLRELIDAGRIDLVAPFQLAGVEGKAGILAAVTVRSLGGDRHRRIEADILLPFFGLASDPGPIARWGLTMERHHIRVDPATCESTRSGIFAVGDIAGYPGKLKLILSGFAEAAMAAHAIYPRVHPGRALHFEYSTTRGLPAAKP